MIPHLSFFDPSDAFDISSKAIPACPILDAENVYKPVLRIQDLIIHILIKVKLSLGKPIMKGYHPN
jgi:hypothetical protein